ncbi:unnamed protein product [Phyllotreta striolata]|uniref:Carboxylesterase type B domain-containing protein n=1 Tax=Phyllotreta striolata TaxID=444603 RepID=A0A9P0DQN0_PHYSR|nr:unnamed protein product [Phyllotreta striolata]
MRSITMDSPIVAINEGKIRGKLSKDHDGGKFYSFLGVPFGKPPIGELRFKAPQPVESWEDVKDATKDADPCYQQFAPAPGISAGSEDCLYLNVYTKTLPSEEQKLKPVMVWFYGGAFIYGTNASTMYAPDYLITKDVVMVAMNYRIGFLGFLHLNDPSLDVPGNAGLKDQQLALKWVQRNIKHFNGDPDNVTIFGESAGSASVHYQVVSPSSEGLFHRAIMQSGSLHNPWPYCRDDGLELARLAKDDVIDEKEALEVLRSLPVAELHSYQRKFIESRGGDLGIVGPTVEYPNETAFITSPPAQIIASGRYNKVPILLGYTNREGLLFEALKRISGKTEIMEESSSNMNLESLVHPHMGLKKDDPKRKIIAKKYAEFYFQGENAKDKVMLLTDLYFFAGIFASSVHHARTSGQPVYLYRMSLDAGLNTFKLFMKMDEPGACHADDLGYLLKSFTGAEPQELGPVEEKAMRSFVEMWTNFARYGNPTPEGSSLNVTWKPFEEIEQNYLDIDKTLTLLKKPEEERVNFWREIFKLSPSTENYL